MLLQHNLRRLLRHPEVQSVAPELGEPEDHPLAFRAASLLTDWTEPQRALQFHLIDSTAAPPSMTAAFYSPRPNLDLGPIDIARFKGQCGS